MKFLILVLFSFPLSDEGHPNPIPLWTGNVNPDGAIQWHIMTPCEEELKFQIEKYCNGYCRPPLNSIMPKCTFLLQKNKN